jgi:hypothetical protein
MSLKTKKPTPVAADQVAQRIAEYRRGGFERKAPAQVVYLEAHAECPWPGCGHRIDGIHFQLEKWADAADRDRLLESWWQGPGLVGLCPKCRRYVLFSVTDKSAVSDVARFAAALLPDDWLAKAHLVTKSSKSKP